MSANWTEKVIDVINGSPIPRNLVEKMYVILIGKCKFTIGDRNKRLSVAIGDKTTFKGGEFDQGYFDTIEQAHEYVDRYKREFYTCKNMDQLTRISCQ